MRETTAHFIPISQVAEAGDTPLQYGSSPLRMVDAGESSSAQLSQQVLGRLQTIGLLSSDVHVNNTALVHELNGNAFVHANGTADRFLNARFVLPDGSGGYRYGRDVDVEKITRREKTVVITGTCLFSVNGVKAIDSSGGEHLINNPQAIAGITEPITTITIDQDLQAYEADSILRISSMLKELQLAQGSEIDLCLPRLEYYYYLLDAYENGLVAPETLSTYFAEVDARAERLEVLIKRRLPEGVTIRHNVPLAPTEFPIRDAVQKGERDLFPRVIDTLNQDPLFAKGIKRAKPKNFVDLARLSYPIGYLSQAGPESLVIGIENPEEVRIMGEVVKLLPGNIKNGVIIGIYPHPKLLVQPEDAIGGRQYMYFSKATGRAPLYEVFRANSALPGGGESRTIAADE